MNARPSIRLLDPNRTPAVGGLRVPGQFYQVLAAPMLLAGAQLPGKAFPWRELHKSGYRSVVCLCSENPRYCAAPLQVIFARDLQDFAACPTPPDEPEQESQLIGQAVDLTLKEIRGGRGVLVHCAGGRGRTGTVIGGVLCRLGYDFKETVDYLDGLHQLRGKPGWPEHPWQAEVLQRFIPSGDRTV